MKKILILLLALVFLAACSKSDVPCEKKDPKDIFDSPEMCWSLKSQKEKNLDMCDKITSNTGKRSACIGNVAGKLNDLEACKERLTVERLKEVHAKLFERKWNPTASKETIARAKASMEKQIVKRSKSEIRNCIYRHYNEKIGMGSATPPDDFLDYASYKP